MVEIAPPTEAAGVAQADTQSAFAWALDDGEELPRRQLTPGWITAGAVTLSVLAIAAAVAVAMKYRPAPEVPSIPISTVVVAAPVVTPPVTVTTVVVPAQTVTKQPPKAEVPTGVPVTDAHVADPTFIAELGSRWEITDAKLASTRAHQVCGYLESGHSVDGAVNQILATYGPGPYQDWEVLRARDFVGTAMKIYPSCP